MLSRFRSFAVLALVVVAPVAGGQAINRATSGLAAPAQTITFETQANGTSANTQYSGGGVTFGPNQFYTADGYFSNSGGGQTLLTNYPQAQCNCTSPTDIFFSSPVQGAAFQYITFPGVSTFTALLNGYVVSVFSGTTDLAGMSTAEWYGFDNTIEFDQINIQSGGPNVNSGTSDNAFALDNLQVGVVATPEPASMALVATGLIGIFGLARRRRNRAAV